MLKTHVGQRQSVDPIQISTNSAGQSAVTAVTGAAQKEEKETKSMISPKNAYDTNKINIIQPPPTIIDTIMPSELKAMSSKETKPKFPESTAVAPEIETTKPIITNNPPITSFENSFPLPNVMTATQPHPIQITNNNNNMTSTPATGTNGSNAMALPFLDPLEHSLASLESTHEKHQDMDIIMRDIQKAHQQLQLGSSQMTVPHLSQQPQLQQQPQQQQLQQHTHNAAAAAINHLVSEFNGMNGNPMNGIMNILGMQNDATNNLQFVNHQMKGSWPTSMPVAPLQGLSLLNTETLTVTQQNAVNFSQKNEKMLLTPKPIEELLATPMTNDKTKMLTSADARVSYAFGQTFKYEQNLKNASSWSQLASAEAAASQSAANKSRLPSDTFQEFRTKAKEQQQRQKQEQEKIKMQKEQEFKRQQESLFKQTKSEPPTMAQM